MNKVKARENITAYTSELIGMIKTNCELKIECIKKKKSISYCRRRINRGLAVDTGRMQDEIVKEMSHYYTRLNMIHEFIETYDLSGIGNGDERMEGVMDEILSAEPYTFRELVHDEEKRSAFIEQLQAEHEDYEQYLEILTDRMKSVINFPQ